MGRTSEEKVLRLYLENPEKDFTVRDISKLTKVPKSTAHKIREMIKKCYLSDPLLFRIKKINYYSELLVSAGLIESLIQELNPSFIILFGSFRKGESNKDSDIDLFVGSHLKKEINLKKYEKKLGHKIDLFIEPDLNKINRHLFNNVVNGIKLYGSFRIK